MVGQELCNWSVILLKEQKISCWLHCLDRDVFVMGGQLLQGTYFLQEQTKRTFQVFKSEIQFSYFQFLSGTILKVYFSAFVMQGPLADNFHDSNMKTTHFVPRILFFFQSNVA